MGTFLFILILAIWSFSGVIALVLNEPGIDIDNQKNWPLLWFACLLGPLMFGWFITIQKLREAAAAKSVEKTEKKEKEKK